MRAAVLHTIPGELVVIEHGTVDQAGPRQVLVRSTAAGVRHRDHHGVAGRDELVSARVPLERSNEADAQLESGEVARAVIVNGS